MSKPIKEEIEDCLREMKNDLWKRGGCEAVAARDKEIAEDARPVEQFFQHLTARINETIERHKKDNQAD
jgi:hypothetical protein